jgi:hypothetical protein
MLLNIIKDRFTAQNGSDENQNRFSFVDITPREPRFRRGIQVNPLQHISRRKHLKALGIEK